MNKNARTKSFTLKRLSGQSILTLIISLTAVSVVNADWRFEPVLRVGGEKDDNPTLSVRTDDVLDDTGYLIDASVRFDYRSELTQFYITPRILSRNYSDHPDELDSDDLFLDVSFSHDTESSTFGFGLGYDSQTVRTAERADADLDVDDPGEIPDDDTGFVGFQDEREKWRFAPGWSYRFSDANSLGVEFNYTDVTYAEAFQVFLNDYTDAQLRVSFDRKFSERTTWVVSATGRNFETADGSNETTSYGFMAGFERSLSETTYVRALIGVEDIDSTISEADPTLIADISLWRRLETINLLAQYRRSVNSGGSGKLSSRDAININLSRRLNEKVTAGLGARISKTDSLDDSVSINERDYIQLRAQFIWHLSSRFATELDYRYTFQQRSALPDSSNSNQVILWFVYQPNSIDRRFR